MEEMKKGGIMTEGQQYVWKGAIPLQIHLHDSEVTTLPHPPPALILAPRLGYLPLLISQIKPFFTSALPPGVDTVWFEYKGLPLKWYIPTGVLFDLLCAEPERPWNLTVHFRGYPGQVLSPCEGEDSVKWSFINTLKEAAYIITGNSKTIMNMSQTDQTELWRSVLNGQSEVYHRISSKLKLGIVGDELSKSRQSGNDSEAVALTRTGKIPVRLYIRNIDVDLDDFEDEPNIDNWDNVAYINRPVEIRGEEGKLYTLFDAVKELLPELFEEESATDTSDLGAEKESEQQSEDGKSSLISSKAKIKLIRIQGIEPQLEIPFGWVVRNLMNPEHYLHICVYVQVIEPSVQNA